MAGKGRRRRSAIIGERSESLSTALQSLFSIVETLSTRVRLTVLCLDDGMLEIVGSKGAHALPLGTRLESPVMATFRSRLLDHGPFVTSIGGEGLPQDIREALARFEVERAFIAPLHSIDGVTECVIVDEPGSKMTFGASRRRLLAAAVGQARIALENADLRMQAAEREVTMETIVRLGIAFGSVVGLEETAAQVVDYAAMLLDVPAFVLLFRREGAPDFEVLAAEGLPHGASRLKVTPIELSGLEASRPRDLTLGNIPHGATGSLFSALQGAGLTHALVAPMVVGDGRLRGVLLGLDRRTLEPGSEELDAFHLLSLQAATAIWSAELFEAERDARLQATHELANTRMLQDVAIAASASTSIGEVCERTLRAAAKHLDVTIGAVYGFNAAENCLDRIVSLGMSDELIAELSHLDVAKDSSSLVTLAARELRLVVSEEMPSHRARDSLLALTGTQGLRAVAVPLQTGGGTLLGTLSFVFPKSDSDGFEDAERDLLASVGGIIGEAFQKARLMEAEAARARFGQALADIDAALHSSMSFDEIIEGALSLGGAVLDADTGGVSLHQPGCFVVRYLWRLPSERMATVIPDEHNPHGVSALETGRPVAVSDTTTDARVVPWIMKEWGITAVMAIPLIVRGNPIGVLFYNYHSGPHLFNDEALEFADKLGASVSLALDNANRFEEQLARTRRMAVLKELAEIGATEFSVKDVADRVVEAVIRLLDASNAVLALPHGDVLDPVALVGYPDDIAKKLTPLPDDSLAAQAYHSGQPRFVEDLKTSDVSEFTRTTADELGVGAFAVLPLMAGGAPIGAVVFMWREVRRFDPDEVAFLSSVVSQAALGVRNAQLFEAERESARLSEALNGLNRVVHSTLETDRVMQHALDAGIEVLGCDSGTIEMLEAGDWVVRYQSGFSPSDVGVRLGPREAPTASRAEQESSPFQVGLLYADEKSNVGLVREYGLKSVLAVPLLARGSIIGCAQLYTSKNVRHFTDPEIDFGRKLGAVVSLGLENARLYSIERNTAQTLQRALLTLPESLRGIEFAPLYHSATESTLVGGDFYDIFELDNDRVGITIGDISGKGLGAAVLTSLVKDTIRAHANELAKTPAEVLTLTNNLVYKATPAEAFATVFFGILDRRDGRLSYANAGHTTAAIVNPDGAVTKLPVTDPILGAFAALEYCEAEAQLQLGEILFLYTDGLTEARGAGAFYGEERLFELLALSNRTSASDLIADTMDDVMAFALGHLRDDLAILAVRRVDANDRQ